MSAFRLAGLFLIVLLCGCTAGVDVQPMLRDFDAYESGLREAAAGVEAIEVLEAGKSKRDEAGALVERGKESQALPLAEKALADAELALEIQRMNEADHRAEKCRLAVEQARAKWSEAVYVLNQTMEFVGKTKVSESAPQAELGKLELPASVLMPDSFPPSSVEAVSEQWSAWSGEAVERKIAAPDLENAFRESQDRARAQKTAAADVDHHKYLAARAVQMLECRVRKQEYERQCLEATRLAGEYSEARAEALRATLDLERDLQSNLRRELDEFRAEAKTRQDELYDALHQMEGQFASIRRDARGTIVSLADILFDFDKATLRREVEFNLVKIATILNQFPEMKIHIEGHTDDVGSDEYNLGLSQKRAQAVFDFMASQDVDENRMTSEGYGETRPVADNESEQGRQQNRRVDLVIRDEP